MQEKLTELMKDKEFVKKILEMETPEEVQKALAEKGVDLSIEQIEDIRKGIIARVSSEEEMSDEQLEQVAGGFIGDLINLVTDVVIKTGEMVDSIMRSRRRSW